MLIERLYPSSPVKLEQDNIDIILDACNALRNGNVTVNDLWPGRKRDMHVLLSEKHTTDQAAHDLLMLRRTLRALERLQLSLRAKIHFTEKNVWPAVLYHGLETLPDDVLMKILQLCYHIPALDSEEMEDQWDAVLESHKNVRRLALVNRRFSNVVHHLPSLWSDKTGLRRSKGIVCMEPSILGTPVVAGLHAIRSCVRTNSDTLLRHVDKLCSIDSDTDLSLPCRKDEAVITMHILKSLRFDYEPSINLESLHLLALQHLRIRGDLPRMLMPQLATLSIKIPTMRTPKGVETFIETLTSASKLQELHLDLRFAGNVFRGVDWIRKTSHLPDLEWLSLSITFGLTHFKASFLIPVAAIISSIDAPRLRHVGLYFHDTDKDFTATCPWHEIFPPHRNYSNLQSVELSTDDRKSVTELCPGLLRALPLVKSLVLRLVCLKEDNEVIPDLAKLRELTLDDCDMDVHALERVLSRIFAQKEVNLEHITINSREPYYYGNHSFIPIGWEFLHEKLAKADETVYLDFS